MKINFKDHTKDSIKNKEIQSDVHNEDLSRKILKRVFAVNLTFENVKFMQADFVDCYFRNCNFIGCDFTGSSFLNSNFRGSRYEGCQFKYSTWENTHLDEDFLENCLPSEENLARDLVRTLRVNYGQIGNYEAVNKAASVEVALTGKHLFSAAYSKQFYYRSKYKGLQRISHGYQHFQWKVLDLLWGNGESLIRTILSGAFLLAVCATCISWNNQELKWPDAMSLVVKSFFGVSTEPALPDWQLASLTALQLLLVGLFLAIVIKRLARR